ERLGGRRLSSHVPTTQALAEQPGPARRVLFSEMIMIRRLAAALVLASLQSALADTAPQKIDAAALAQRVTLDQSVDPCAAFFASVCRRVVAANPIPADQPRWGRFDVLGLHNREVLRDLLEEAAGHPSPDGSKVGDFYAACIDEKLVEDKGAAPLKPELD